MVETTIKIAGVSFANRDGTKRQDILGVLYDDYWTEGLEAEIKIELRREPKNKHDRNAVAIHVIAPKEAAGQIGYIPADNSEYVSDSIREGLVRKAVIENLGVATGNKVFGTVKLSIASTDDGADDEPEEEASGRYLVEDEEGRVYEFEN